MENMTLIREEGIEENMLAIMEGGKTAKVLGDELVQTLSEHDVGVEDKWKTKEEI